MSGTGKSTALRELRSLCYQAVDTDEPPWTEWSDEDGGYVWREDLIADLLSRDTKRPWMSREPSRTGAASTRASTRSCS